MSWLTIILCALVVLNATATAAVLRNGLFTARQRVLQLLLAWLIPVVGAVICLIVVATQKSGLDVTRDANFHPADAHWDVVPGHIGGTTAGDGD